MIKVVYEPENSRAAAYDDDKIIGECTYVVRDGVWLINHTLVNPEYGGQGIATKLVEELVEQARENDIKIYPVCVFAKKEFSEKPEYADVLAKK